MIKLKQMNRRLVIQGQDTESIAKSIFILSCILGFSIGAVIGVVTNSVLFALLYGPAISLVLDGAAKLLFYLERKFVADNNDGILRWNCRFGKNQTDLAFDEVAEIKLDTTVKKSYLRFIPVNNPTIHRLWIVDKDRIQHLVLENNDGNQIRSASQKLAWMLEKPVEDRLEAER